MIVPLAYANPALESELFNENKTVSKLEYQSASMFTHLEWFPEQKIANSIEILPIVNFSGIPIEQRTEKANYYTHGKIPSEINQLFTNLIHASHYFNAISTSQNSKKKNKVDYQFQLQINQYKLPFKYAPDDNWWAKVHDNVDRWLLSENSAKISLTLKIIGGKLQTAPWTRTIESVISACELNQSSQPMRLPNNNKAISEYSLTTTGQAFIAASNFLIVQAIHHINKKSHLAHVASKFDNEIFITSDRHQFSIGQKLNIFHNNEFSQQSVIPAGQVQIIKARQNQAVAYPINIRADQIKKGDWVQASQADLFTPPKSIFMSSKSCTKVQVVNISSTAL